MPGKQRLALAVASLMGLVMAMDEAQEPRERQEMKMSEIVALRDEVAALRRRVETLEDEAAIRRLHWTYGYLIDYCQYEDVVQLFAQDGEVLFLSGIYRGHAGVRRLYVEWFQNLFTRGADGPVDGFLLDHYQMQDVITVADDRMTANGRFRANMAGGFHEICEHKPEGVPEQFMEAGIYENSYVRENGIWKIKRLDYIVQWQAEYDKGWSKTESHLQPFKDTFPGNPIGPDELVGVERPAWPARARVPFHYAHPVVGASLNR